MMTGGFLVLLATLPGIDGCCVNSTATYTAPMSGPGSEDSAVIRIKTPDGDGKFPVFMWLMGTFEEFENTEPNIGNIYDEFTEYMATKGYIAAYPDYQNGDFCVTAPCADAECSTPTALHVYLGIPGGAGALSKIGQPEKARGLKKALDVLCALPRADCSLGVAVAGFSQGAFLTVQLATIDTRVTAIAPWGYGYMDISDKDASSCFASTVIDKHVPKEKRRMVIGAADHFNSLDTDYDMKGPQVFSGYTCNSIAAPIDCIQPDGSGYYVIATSEYTEADKNVTLPDNVAGHTFFGTTENIDYYTEFVPTFKSGAKPWNMKPIFDWLATAAKVSGTSSGNATAGTSTEAGTTEAPAASTEAPGTNGSMTTTIKDNGVSSAAAGRTLAPFSLLALMVAVTGIAFM